MYCVLIRPLCVLCFNSSALCIVLIRPLYALCFNSSVLTNNRTRQNTAFRATRSASTRKPARNYTAIRTSKMIAITNLSAQLAWNLQSTKPATSLGTANSTTIQTHQESLRTALVLFLEGLCYAIIRYTQINALQRFYNYLILNKQIFKTFHNSQTEHTRKCFTRLGDI